VGTRKAWRALATADLERQLAGYGHLAAARADFLVRWAAPPAPRRAYEEALLLTENTVSVVVARHGWSGRLVPAARGDSREHWRPNPVPAEVLQKIVKVVSCGV